MANTTPPPETTTSETVTNQTLGDNWEAAEQAGKEAATQMAEMESTIRERVCAIVETKLKAIVGEDKIQMMDKSEFKDGGIVFKFEIPGVNVERLSGITEKLEASIPKDWKLEECISRYKIFIPNIASTLREDYPDKETTEAQRARVAATILAQRNRMVALYERAKAEANLLMEQAENSVKRWMEAVAPKEAGSFKCVAYWPDEDGPISAFPIGIIITPERTGISLEELQEAMETKPGGEDLGIIYNPPGLGRAHLQIELDEKKLAILITGNPPTVSDEGVEA